MNIVHRWRRLVAVSLFSLLFFGACSLSDAAAGKVHGKVQYEKILFRNPKTGAAGLDLAHPVLRPVAGAKVELVDAAAKVLARGVTDAAGAYTLSWSAAAAPSAHVRVLADADNAVIVDHFSPHATYAVSSENWTLPEGVASKDIVAKDKTRDSGPFNILAALQIGNKMLRAAEPGIAIPRVTIFWTTKHRAGTSYFMPSTKQAYILGDRAVDSDEFDDVVILHEYGHFIAAVFAKDDSPGGNHNRGEKVDPRLAWGEGWGNFFACAALNDPRYVDTGVTSDGSGVRIQYSLDDDAPAWDNPGYWSEHSVGGVLWDIFDKRPGKNHLGCGFGEIWRALRSKAWNDLPPYRHLIDFADIFVARNPGIAKGVTAILAARGIKYSPGKTPSVPNPFVRALKTGAIEAGDLDSRPGTNKQGATAVFSFTLTEKKKVNLHLDIVSSKDKKNADLDLYLIGADGKTIKSSRATNGVGGTESIAQELPAGRYFVEVRSFSTMTSGATVTNTGSFKMRADY
ncbi:MAG: pre-peptidase C-terminal domain-containing protein [Gemmataceae bacterium]